MKKLLAAGLALFGATKLLVMGAQPAVVWDGAHAQFFSDHDGPFTLGFQFRATSDIRVTALGAFDYLGDGLATSHQVGLWSAEGGEPLAVALVPAGADGVLLGQFRYVAIAGLTLSAGADYVVAASEYYGEINDIYAGSVPVSFFSMDPALSFQGARGAGQAAGLHFPTVQFDALSPATFGGSFQFEVVPEPSTTILLGGGLLALVGGLRAARRSRAGRNPGASIC